MKCMMQDNFNSIKVRLKQESEQYPIDEHHDFNSIKVRLKPLFQRQQIDANMVISIP